MIETLREVYRIDGRAREEKLTAQARLELHQQLSAPLIAELEQWLEAQVSERLVEPNSGLRKAIQYMRKHWAKLTLFLRKAGAPLDNNTCERALKKAIINRKNAYFCKSRNGARVGDMYMSLIHTAERSGASPFDYLTALLKNAKAVAAAPGDWVPWSFDLLIAADGSRSRLASAAGLVTSVIEYPYAAMCTVGPWSGDATCLRQIFDSSGRLVGVLPIGGGRASFFWGRTPGEPARIRAAGLDAWRREVADYHPPAAEIVEPLETLNQVTFATYRSVRLRAPFLGRVAFVGDAAHAMSPHLGQGTSLALEDAIALDHALASTPDVSEGLRRYAAARRGTTAYYSRLTAALTPFFQTQNRVLRLGRDLALPNMARLPVVGRQMLQTLAGEKSGWLR